MPWKDATNYSADDGRGNAPSEPLVWSLKNGQLLVNIWRRDGRWHLSCPAFGIDGFYLTSPHVLVAQRQAIAHVKELAYKTYQSARGLTPAAKRKDKPE